MVLPVRSSCFLSKFFTTSSDEYKSFSMVLVIFSLNSFTTFLKYGTLNFCIAIKSDNKLFSSKDISSRLLIFSKIGLVNPSISDKKFSTLMFLLPLSSSIE